jgi:DNA replication protein DnaC
MENCIKHGAYKAEEIEILGIKIKTKCPLCEAEKNKRELEKEEVLQKLKIENDFLNRGIEPEFFNVSLEDYKAETENEEKALKACKDLLEGKIKKVLLLGNNGTGKTMLADALAIKLHGVRVTMYELSAKIREGYSKNKSELEIINALLSYPFIAIDEIGRTKGSEAELNWLSYLIDKAHTRGVRLLLISNKKQAHSLPKERLGEAIEYFLPNDAISRLRQNSVIVEVDGRDRRAVMAAV